MQDSRARTAPAAAGDFASAAFDALPVPAALVDERGSLLAANAAWRQSEAANGRAATGGYFAGFEGQAGGETVVAELRRALRDGEPARAEHSFQVAGRTCWLEIRARRIVAGDRPVLVVTHEDVTERKETEQRQQHRVRELRHRIKNTFAVVNAVAAQTIRATGTLAEFEAAFGSRLRAIERAHTLLIAADWSPTDLRTVVDSAIAPWRSGAPDRIRVEGGSAELAPGRALAVSMILHEIGANAARFGALSTPSGRIDLRWRLDARGPNRELDLIWAESGGPPVAPPQRRGFGTSLIEFSVAHEFGGEVAVDYRPAGVVWSFRLPWERSAGHG